MTIQYFLKSALALMGIGMLLAAHCSVTYSSPLADEKPNWVVSPERSGYISVVGFAPKQSRGGADAQRRVALTKARQQLGEIVRVRVENTLQQEQQVKNGKASVDVNSTTRMSSRAALNLNKAEVTAQWVDSANGDLYLLLELLDQDIGNH